jgi:hypothetical protein
VRVLGPVLLLIAAPAFVVVGIAWGAFYAQWVEPHLHFPDWLSGLAFALLPLSVALVLVLPLLSGPAAQFAPLQPLAAASETIRHLMFGVSLGLIYPLRLARLPRRSRARAAAGLPVGAAASPAM